MNMTAPTGSGFNSPFRKFPFAPLASALLLVRGIPLQSNTAASVCVLRFPSWSVCVFCIQILVHLFFFIHHTCRRAPPVLESDPIS
ncbi:hypothetical protein B0T11DRAFT_46864 [Plectosphaerella cucumerina]|uniref:Uncharacterized protein n=1 Tax=Plectosphaerella cucumerina TaxID=40658 RepID=A0A8K0TNR2_9PEZI|nr:hypothetical protein B0T11DRAFT_46864 [Plectosphaerella cucumerina]